MTQVPYESLATILNVEGSVTNQRWCHRPCDETQGIAIAQSLGELEIIGRLMAARGVTVDEAAHYLSPSLKALLPDPSHLLDMDVAVERIISALESFEPIVIFGDYDVDGATSSALLYRFLTAVGGKVDVYIPDRLKEGYGPTVAAFRAFSGQGAKVIITVDCGTTAFEALEEGRRLGLDVIVIDHHAAEPTLPPAVAVINPNRCDETSSYGMLAAVGLCFLLTVALHRRLRAIGWYTQRREPDLLQYLDLVALGTVCDVMPLRGLNRAYVVQGLKVLAQKRTLGIKTLCERAGLHDIPTAYHLGYVLGPRINAGGRVGKADLGSLLLRCEEHAHACDYAEQLEAFNADRKLIEKKVLEEAISQAEVFQSDPCIVVAAQGWHPGVIGIVAGRLKDLYHRPVCVVGLENNVGKGSGRSITGVDLGALIHTARHKGLLVGGGGHAMAVGFTVEESALDSLRQFLNDNLAESMRNRQKVLNLDGVLGLSAVTPALISSIERLSPFGAGNPTPRFAFGNVQVQWAEQVGENHIRCMVRQVEGPAMNAIAFRAANTPLERLLKRIKGEPIHLAGTIQLNTWQGESRPQLVIDDGAYSG